MTSEQTIISFQTIGEVERETGIPKETLRVWERRYAFPHPGRDAHGERIYPPEQVTRLRQIKRMLDQGYRPGKVMQLTALQLEELAGRSVGVQPVNPVTPEINACLDLLRAHRLRELRQHLAQALLRMGLRAFVTDLVAPLTTAVGDSWAAGTIAVFEEHLFTEALQGVLRAAIDAAANQAGPADGRPRILMTTIPHERHILGLMMAEALFALEGAHCIALGAQTPLGEIVAAARSQRADIVALSFSAQVSTRTAVDNVEELRARLDGASEVWAGGASANLARRQLNPDCVLDLGDIPGAVARWRGAQAALAVQASQAGRAAPLW